MATKGGSIRRRRKEVTERKWRDKNGEKTEDKTKEGSTEEWGREGRETERRDGMLNEP